MLHFHDRAGFALALTLDLDPRLHQLLADRIRALTHDLIDYTEYLVIQPGDVEADIVHAIGLSPLVEPIDGIRYGEPGFEPHWDWLAHHEGWFEMIFTFGGTHAVILLVQDTDDNPNELILMCRQYSVAP